MRTKLDALLTQKSLTLVNNQKLPDVVEFAIDSTDVVETRNVCAKVSPQLADHIDQVCALLDIRKRTFLEAAFIEALEKAESIMEAEGVYDALEEVSAK